MRSRLFLSVFALLLAFAGPAEARGTLDSILPQIRAAHPGRLSDAEPWTDSEGRTHYKIKWMTPEGRILYFNADAGSGRYSSSGGDDGGPWRGNRGRGNDGDDERPSEEDGGGYRNHWNGDGGDWHHDGGGDERHDGGGDWHGHHGGDDHGDGHHHHGGH